MYQSSKHTQTFGKDVLGSRKVHTFLVHEVSWRWVTCRKTSSEYALEQIDPRQTCADLTTLKIWETTVHHFYVIRKWLSINWLTLFSDCEHYLIYLKIAENLFLFSSKFGIVFLLAFYSLDVSIKSCWRTLFCPT